MNRMQDLWISFSFTNSRVNDVWLRKAADHRRRVVSKRGLCVGAWEHQSSFADEDVLSALISVSRPRLVAQQNNIAQLSAQRNRQRSEEGVGDLSLKVDPPSLYSDKRDNPHCFITS